MRHRIEGVVLAICDIGRKLVYGRDFIIIRKIPLLTKPSPDTSDPPSPDPPDPPLDPSLPQQTVTMLDASLTVDDEEI